MLALIAVAFAIVGGEEVEPDVWPGIGVLVDRGCHLTMVTQTVGIAPHHCNVEVGDEVVFGTANRFEPTADVRFVDKATDSVVVELSGITVVEFNEPAPVTPTALALGCALDEIEQGASVTVVGYGTNDVDTETDGVLRQAELVIGEPECTESEGCSSDGSELTAGPPGDEQLGSCFGDGGSPLFLEAEHGLYTVAVASRTRQDGLDLRCGGFDIYTRLDPFVSFIEETAGITLEPPVCAVTPTAEEGGCGCSTSVPMTGWLAIAFLPLFARRRRHPSSPGR